MLVYSASCISWAHLTLFSLFLSPLSFLVQVCPPRPPRPPRSISLMVSPSLSLALPALLLMLKFRCSLMSFTKATALSSVSNLLKSFSIWYLACWTRSTKEPQNNVNENTWQQSSRRNLTTISCKTGDSSLVETTSQKSKSSELIWQQRRGYLNYLLMNRETRKRCGWST